MQRCESVSLTRRMRRTTSPDRQEIGQGEPSCALRHLIRHGVNGQLGPGRANGFVYVQPDRGDEPIRLAPEPSWNRVAYVRR
jgi:hypothetical protein